jgi:hypothetical protein
MLIRVGRTTPESLSVGFSAVVDPTGFFAIVLAVVFRVTFFSLFCTTGFVLVVRFFVVLVAALGRLVAAFLFGVVGFLGTVACLLVVFWRFLVGDGFLVAFATRFGFAGTLFLGTALETDLLEVFGISTSIQNEASNSYFIVHSGRYPKFKTPFLSLFMIPHVVL